VTHQGRNEQTATALKAIATAEAQARHGKVFDLQDHDDGSQRVWSAKVADPDSRQFNLTISHDASSVININEAKTPNDDVQKLRSAKVPFEDAIDTAVEQAGGKGNLTALEIDIYCGHTVCGRSSSVETTARQSSSTAQGSSLTPASAKSSTLALTPTDRPSLRLPMSTNE
jgi:hypothetical protein